VFREDNNILGVFACLLGQPPVPVRYLTDADNPADDVSVSSDGRQYTVYLYTNHVHTVDKMLSYADIARVVLVTHTLVTKDGQTELRIAV